MTTLAQIEQAAEKLPDAELEKLLRHLFARLDKRSKSKDDPFAAMVGAFAGEPGPTGRRAEEILYGPGARA